MKRIPNHVCIRKYSEKNSIIVIFKLLAIWKEKNNSTMKIVLLIIKQFLYEFA